MHFVEKHLYFVNLEKEIKAHESLNKRWRFFILIFIIKKSLNKQYIIILLNVKFIISIKSLNRLLLTNI